MSTREQHPQPPSTPTDQFVLLLGRYRSSDGKEQWLKNIDTLEMTTDINQAIQVAFPSSKQGKELVSTRRRFIVEDSYIPGPRTILRDMTDGRLIDLPGFHAIPYWQLPETKKDVLTA